MDAITLKSEIDKIVKIAEGVERYLPDGAIAEEVTQFLGMALDDEFILDMLVAMMNHKKVAAPAPVVDPAPATV